MALANDLFRELLHAWSSTNINEQKEIELAMDALLDVMNDEPKIIKQFNREIERYESFNETQGKLDNIISLLKICQRLNISYDDEIDVNTCKLDDIISKIQKITESIGWSEKEYNKSQRNLNSLWQAINKKEFNLEDSYVFKNSCITAKDIRQLVPLFDA